MEAEQQSDWMQRVIQLYRGVSVLLWSLPLYLIFAVQTVFTDQWAVLFMGEWDVIGILPTSVVALCALYGVHLVKKSAEEKSPLRMGAAELYVCLVVLAGLSPFYYWETQGPILAYFKWAVFALNSVAIYALVCLSRLIYRMVSYLGTKEERREVALFMLFNSLNLMVLLVCYVVHRMIISEVIVFGNMRYLVYYFQPFLQWIFVLGVLMPTAVCIWWLRNVKILCFQKILERAAQADRVLSLHSQNLAPSEAETALEQKDGIEPKI